MTFEDRLKDQFRRADASIPGERIDWNTTIAKARRSRMRFAALTAVAAVSILGAAAYTITNMDTDPAPIGPATGVSNTPYPETTASAVESPFVERTCSASDLVGTNDHEMSTGLPEAVATTRMQIIDHATQCQYVYLEQLAMAGDGNFSYSYGAEEGPARFWQDRERDARLSGTDTPTLPYMKGLVSILQLPYCRESNDDGTGTDTEKIYYVWPRVHCAAHRTADDWDDLKGIYTDEQIDQMRTSDLYYGFRVGIAEDGDWDYFIAGD